MKFCLSELLFRHVLEQVEKFPETTFTETELRKISSEGFEEMLKGKLLKYQQIDPEQETFPCPTPCEKGCNRVIGKVLGGYRAICPEYSDVKPITLTKSDLSKYIFDVDRLLSILRSKNQLVGSTNRINDKAFFVGERSVGQERVAVMLALFRNGKEAEAELLGLSNQISIRDRTIVLLPFFDKTSQDVLIRLDNQNIFVSRFEEAFPKSDFVIDFARLEARRPETGLKPPPKTPKQQKDYDRYGFLCEDILFITGKEPKKRSNLVRLNDKKISVPDNEMLLLLCLVIELKRNEGGWVTSKRLCDESITDKDIPQRSISRLRHRLLPGLLDGDAEKFVENDGKGSYRISTHPDFVTVEKKNWSVEKYNELKEALKKERARREGQKEKWEKVYKKPRF